MYALLKKDLHTTCIHSIMMLFTARFSKKKIEKKSPWILSKDSCNPLLIYGYTGYSWLHFGYTFCNTHWYWLLQMLHFFCIYSLYIIFFYNKIVNRKKGVLPAYNRIGIGFVNLHTTCIQPAYNLHTFFVILCKNIIKANLVVGYSM